MILTDYQNCQSTNSSVILDDSQKAVSTVSIVTVSLVESSSHEEKTEHNELDYPEDNFLNGVNATRNSVELG